MKVQQYQNTNGQWKNSFSTPGFSQEEAQLILAFGAPDLITRQETFNYLKDLFPKGQIVSCSTAGEIIDEDVYDNSIVVTAIQFEKTTIKCSVTNIKQHSNSYDTGKYLMKDLLADDLSSVFILSDGIHINGCELADGLNENNPRHIPVTGGLAGDGSSFNKTFVGLNHTPQEGIVVAVGFYGNSLKTGHGSFGGFDQFGPDKIITRCEKNVLYEIDGKNALDMYKEYLGPFKDELPGSALLFPLALKMHDSNGHVVRGVQKINEEEKSMLFFGNLVEGSPARLMKGDVSKLIDGSSVAAQNAVTTMENESPQLALLISCVGRKLILQGRSDEEVAASKKIFGDKVPIAGFYSYGEISPLKPFTRCELHNQTMTITTFSES